MLVKEIKVGKHEKKENEKNRIEHIFCSWWKRAASLFIALLVRVCVPSGVCMGGVSLINCLTATTIATGPAFTWHLLRAHTMH